MTPDPRIKPAPRTKDTVPLPDFSREELLITQGYAMVAGIDEAGRGPLAGPVCVAAVILDPACLPAGLDDSKRLTAARRAALYEVILAQARAVSICLAPPAEIDCINIRAATLKAMADALAALALPAAFVLVDGRDIPPGLPCPASALIGGDGLSLSIAAASIIAKVTRDRLMTRLDVLAPGWGFARHAGYGTAQHLAAIAKAGASPWHRLSFAPLKKR